MSSHKKRRELNRATAEHTRARIRAELAQGIVYFENLMEHAMGVRIKELERERDTAWAQAHRLALELECLIMDTNDNAVVSKWWDSAFEAIEEYQSLKPGADEEFEAWAKMRKEPE